MLRFFQKKLFGLGIAIPAAKSRRVRRRRVGGLGGPKSAYNAQKEEARVLVHRKLEEWNLYYKLHYNKVAIRNQRSRWGSCSKKGNLNFNYRIVHLPPHLQDYVIVHELCHLSAFNHSKMFWALVGETISDHREKRKELGNYTRKSLRSFRGAPELTQ